MRANYLVMPATAPGGCNTSAPTLGKKPPKVEYDKAEFTLLEQVPIFDAHSGSEDDLDDIEFDAELLKQICDQCNARVADTGDMVPVTDRHSSDEPDAPTPEILGYACNFQMGTIGNEEPRPCIMADLNVFTHKMDKVKGRPRRSIELWPDQIIDPIVLRAAKEPAIDSIALLDGVTRPARDLGLLFSKNKKGRARYQHELQNGKEDSLNPEELIKQCVEALSNMPEMAFIRDLMEKQKGEQEAESYSEEEKKMKAEEEEETMKEAEEEEDKKEEEEVEPAKLRMQRDQERRKYARLDSQYKALFAKVDALEKDKRQADRKADLLGLEQEGYTFDLAEELDYVSDLEPVRYSKHLSKIKKNYGKAPVGVNITPARVNGEGGRSPVTVRPEDVYAKVADKYSQGRTFANRPEEVN